MSRVGAAAAQPSRGGVHRILMTTDTVGGVWTFALELTRALAPHHVTLAAMGGKANPCQRSEAERIPNLELFDSDLKVEWMDDPWDDVRRAGDWLQEIESRVRPDLIHFNTLAHGGLPWRAPIVATAHSCVLSWWTAVKYERAPAIWHRYGEEVRRTLHAANLVTAPSSVMLDCIFDHYKLTRHAMVVPNGRDSRKFAAGTKEPFIFASGRLWDEGKNVAALERIAPRLPWPVHLAGEGGTLGQLSSEELAGWYARASIYSAPARYEPFGLSILEAALSGCALVLGDIPSLREVWGDAALFVAPEDNRQLESALQWLIADSTRRQDYSKRARERACIYTPERMAEGYLAAYESVAGAACAS